MDGNRNFHRDRRIFFIRKNMRLSGVSDGCTVRAELLSSELVRYAFFLLNKNHKSTRQTATGTTKRGYATVRYN